MYNHTRLKEAGLAKGMSKPALVFDLDKNGLRTSYPTISNWEDGKTIPKANELDVLAVTLDKKIDFFFS